VRPAGFVPSAPTLALMPTSSEDLAAKAVVDSVRAAFAEESALVEDALNRDYYDEDAYFAWMERFSQRTTDAIKGRDFIKAGEHLSLLSKILAEGNEHTLRVDRCCLR